MTLRSRLCQTSLSIRSSELSLLAVEIQTPYWPLGGKASSTDSEARPRDCLSVRDCRMVHGASHLRAIACNLGHLLCHECETVCTNARDYCFHRLAMPKPSKRNFEVRSTFCAVSVLVTSFIFNLPATSLVPYRACLCKLVNLDSKTSFHVSDHTSVWVRVLTVINFIQIDSIFRGESH